MLYASSHMSPNGVRRRSSRRPYLDVRHLVTSVQPVIRSSYGNLECCRGERAGMGMSPKASWIQVRYRAGSFIPNLPPYLVREGTASGLTIRKRMNHLDDTM